MVNPTTFPLNQDSLEISASETMTAIKTLLAITAFASQLLHQDRVALVKEHNPVLLELTVSTINNAMLLSPLELFAHSLTIGLVDFWQLVLTRISLQLRQLASSCTNYPAEPNLKQELPLSSASLIILKRLETHFTACPLPKASIILVSVSQWVPTALTFNSTILQTLPKPKC